MTREMLIESHVRVGAPQFFETKRSETRRVVQRVVVLPARF